MTAQLLLKNGTVLQHDAQDNIVVLRNTDILIHGSRIAEIGNQIPVTESMEAIDCHDKIISPGFIDAHHHLWQTQLKGRFGDHTLLDYMVDANLQSLNFTPDDIFWGQLGGCLEVLDSGTTCVVDNAHMSSGPEHGSAALEATAASGLRAIFCYGVSPLRAIEWTENSFEIDRSPLPSWLLPQMKAFASRAPFGIGGRVQLGFFFDSYSLPQDMIIKTLSSVREFGVKVITSHFRHWPISTGQAHIPEILASCEMLREDILLAHGNGTTASQATILSDAGVYITSTPDAELLMASGADPVAFRSDLPLTCLGADCHSSGPTSMLHQMQMALSSDRGAQTSSAFRSNLYPQQFRATVQKTFNLATIQAARAVRMDDEIGSIAVGKLADLVIFDSTTPSMACAADYDPLTAIVRHAGVREIDTVIIGGDIRKLGGQLQDIKCPSSSNGVGAVEFLRGLADDGNLSWSEIAQKVSVSRKEVQRRIESVNKDLARSKLGLLMGGLEHVLAPAV